MSIILYEKNSTVSMSSEANFTTVYEYNVISKRRKAKKGVTCLKVVLDYWALIP